MEQNFFNLSKTITIMGDFKKLKVWQKARSLAVEVYQLANDHYRLSRDFGLRDQMQRAAVSIVSNIAEGDELGSNKQSIRYFRMAKASAAELITQLDIAAEIEYVDREVITTYIDRCQIISSMLHNLIQSRKEPKDPK